MTSTPVPRANGTTSLVDSGIIEAGSPLTTQVTNGPMQRRRRGRAARDARAPRTASAWITLPAPARLGWEGLIRSFLAIGGSAVANLTTAGIFQDTNGITSTPIGAASPSTGGFTTLGASGNVTFPGSRYRGHCGRLDLRDFGGIV